MNKKQVIKFISKLNLKYKITIKYFYNEDYYPCVAFVSFKNNTIYLNRKIFLYNKNINELKATLMHEIGHFQTKNQIYLLKHGKRISSEYLAHRWALKTSYKHKYFKIYDELINDVNCWPFATWNQNNGFYRPYIKAAILLKKYLKKNCYPIKSIL
jgi:hypothetical protein